MQSQLSPMQSQVSPTQVSPTQQFVQTNVTNTVVPHVHPSHTTTVNRHMINHEHYFPHTQSVVNQCCERHIMCNMPHHPNCKQRKRGFGF
ncbi:CotD family spore coat protein [Solibacillus sp. FSL H8-0538]|uniref:CotD family spore coat protein n=1 Tax=Solibacillus sp. FSL H8-0538 TaxID=2921400 RepID=UPI0030F7E767